MRELKRSGERPPNSSFCPPLRERTFFSVILLKESVWHHPPLSNSDFKIFVNMGTGKCPHGRLDRKNNLMDHQDRLNVAS